MSAERQQRIFDLLQKKRRSTRLPPLVALWTALGARVSPLADERQRELIHCFRAAGSFTLEPTPNLEKALLAFVEQFEMVVVVEWDANEHPAVLLSTKAFARSASKLRSVYRDGFWLADTALSKAIVVSFDEDRAEVEVAALELSYAQG
ncbi:hypothetical protein ACIQTU_14990 [Brevundimonas sp. NPDC090276]|uniref:hypothetical protein n=1 Tax=Brevundimonas sp. NPDC090276 TaxID=3363956 RepID=UPI00383AFF48